PGSLRCRHQGRLDAFRRCRLLQRRRPARGDRPHQGPGGNLARRALLAAISREQAEILAQHRRGRGAGRRTRRTRGDDLHPLLHHLEMGGEEPPRLHYLYRPVLAARSVCDAAKGGRSRQRHAAAGAAHLALPAALQGARCRRRRAHPHAKGPPRRHQREIRRYHRR
ncbi:hypothetical protein KXV85_005769, partial [Aspergillus fumigatus]